MVTETGVQTTNEVYKQQLMAGEIIFGDTRHGRHAYQLIKATNSTGHILIQAAIITERPTNPRHFHLSIAEADATGNTIFRTNMGVPDSDKWRVSRDIYDMDDPNRPLQYSFDDSDIEAIFTTLHTLLEPYQSEQPKPLGYLDATGVLDAIKNSAFDLPDKEV